MKICGLLYKVSLFSLCILWCSCGSSLKTFSIEKRIYMKGYYVHFMDKRLDMHKGDIIKERREIPVLLAQGSSQNRINAFQNNPDKNNTPVSSMVCKQTNSLKGPGITGFAPVSHDIVIGANFNNMANEADKYSPKHIPVNFKRSFQNNIPDEPPRVLISQGESIGLTLYVGFLILGSIPGVPALFIVPQLLPVAIAIFFGLIVLSLEIWGLVEIISRLKRRRYKKDVLNYHN